MTRFRMPSPPWGRPQSNRSAKQIHQRWIDQLRTTLVEGTLLETMNPPWPVTFGSLGADGEWEYDECGDHTLQCGGCRFYCELRGPLGLDWGVCTNPASEHDRMAVFEHWTCRRFTP